MASKSSSGCGSALAIEQDLVEGVAAQAEPKRLERDDLVGRDVAQVHLGPELGDEPGLRGFRRRLEDELTDVDLVDDLVDEARPHLAGRPVDAGGAGLAS